jgi:hypothetical protein
MSCDYESMRLLNIQRNKQMLKQLGFGDLVTKIFLKLEFTKKTKTEKKFKRKKIKKNSNKN